MKISTKNNDDNSIKEYESHFNGAIEYGERTDTGFVEITVAINETYVEGSAVVTMITADDGTSIFCDNSINIKTRRT